MTKKVSREQYQINFVDTAIGNLKGILIRYIAKDTTLYAKNIVCYVTMANSHFYSFQVVSPEFTGHEELQVKYFNMIKFKFDEIPESKYINESVLIKRD